jgi:dTDP-4-amino-4,6-dideoxygalactose transaminase
MTERFTGTFTQQQPIPEAGVEAALAVLRHGRLHRYNTVGDDPGETALLEREFADWLGARYCLATASGGAAMTTALRALGVGQGERVLTNAFTLAPVPGAIAAVGAKPVYVETTRALTLDLDDLRAKAGCSGATVLLLSHMRGHLCDMEALTALCRELGVTVIEDCAHTMGAAWNDMKSGRWGRLACFSTQTYKHMNSGEGGFLTGDDDQLMARAILLSGSYMNHDRHLAAPPAEAFTRARYDCPNVSCRMDNLRAAILRAQLPRLEADCAAWTERYRAVEAGLAGAPGVELITRPPAEGFVGSSFQFLLPGRRAEEIERFAAACAARGVELKWFGAEEPRGFTSRHDHWRFAPPQRLPRTDAVLAELLDMRLPLTFSLEDCATLARIIAEEAARLPARAAAAPEVAG